MELGGLGQEVAAYLVAVGINEVVDLAFLATDGRFDEGAARAGCPAHWGPENLGCAGQWRGRLPESRALSH